MTIPEPKCVQWKRQWQRAARKKIAGMTREEELAHWDERYQELVRIHGESKRHLQEKQVADGAPAKC